MDKGRTGPGWFERECGGQASTLGQNSRTRNIWPTTKMRLLTQDKTERGKGGSMDFAKRNVDEEPAGVYYR